MIRRRATLLRYLWSCVWLTFPALAFNVAFISWLPPAFHSATFWHDIPAAIAWPEKLLRMLVFAFPAMMKLAMDSPRRKAGWALYLGGTATYFIAWLAQMLWPQSAWSTSAIGFLAPAFTPALWLVGIALIGDELFVWPRYRWWMYACVVAGFLTFHISHAYLVFSRL